MAVWTPDICYSIKPTTEYIICLSDQNEKSYQPKTVHKNELSNGFCFSSLAQVGKKLIIFKSSSKFNVFKK